MHLPVPPLERREPVLRAIAMRGVTVAKHGHRAGLQAHRHVRPVREVREDSGLSGDQIALEVGLPVKSLLAQQIDEVQEPLLACSVVEPPHTQGIVRRSCSSPRFERTSW